MNHTNTILHQNNEIHLHRLAQILMKYKLLIVGITFLSTAFAVIYARNATPIYVGNVILEMGEIVYENQILIEENQKVSLSLKPITSSPLENNINDLKEIIPVVTGVSATIPPSSTNLIQLSIESSNKNEIKQKLQNAVDFIINRHKEKVKFYQNNNSKIYMTQLIGDIKVNLGPTSSKLQRNIITAFFSGLLLSIFLAFALEFFQRNHKPRD